MNHEEIKNFYNRTARYTKESGGYEYNRWFKNKLSKQIYQMTAEEVERISKSIVFNDYLEMGCGPGVWTKFFIEEHQGKNFDLVDISEDMIKQAKTALSQYEKIRYFVNDFLYYLPDKKYDFFLSGRAFEYLENKKLAVKKIKDLLSPGGIGCIITKTPKYIRSKFLHRRINFPHGNQIYFSELRMILEDEGFREINFFPATVYFPIFKSTLFNAFLAKFIKGKKLNSFSSLFTESYCVTFKK